ncbi:MAG TPA: hypothetical protein VEU96_11985 [Bryobacteraceae bacterium]|nr:hypothetical protein [Bryobacteraceae bacterium]
MKRRTTRMLVTTAFLLAATSAIAGPPKPPKGSTQDSCGYPFGTAPALSSVVFSESDTLQAFDFTNGVIRAWYTDEHALTLGVRRVVVKTSTGTTTTDYPFTDFSGVSAVNPLVGTTFAAGDQAGTDLATYNPAYGFLDHGRPLWPALYITDITDPNNIVPGDWQQGGSAIPPSAVYGTWKAAVRTVDRTHTPALITVTPDIDPVKNNWNGIPDVPPGGFGTNDGYGAEIVWNVGNLLSGHTYRLQFMTHDGDQNKSGGDAGEACVAMSPVIVPQLQ